MKKILTLSLVMLALCALVGCSSNKQEEQPITEEEPIVGGYTEVEDGTITDELTEIFNSATQGLMGATYNPEKLLATQVVAGTNYKFLCSGKKTTSPVIEGTYNVIIYKDLQGNCSILDIEVVEEHELAK